MIYRTFYIHSSQWKVIPSLLRHPFNSNFLIRCLRGAPARLPAIYTRYSNTATSLGNSFLLLSGYGVITQRTRCLVQRHWKRITAGTLCGSGVLLSRMADGETSSADHMQKYAAADSKDDTMYRVHIADQSSYCEATFSQFTLQEKVYIVLRCIYLTLLFSPAAILYGVSRLLHSIKIESLAWCYVMRAVQTAGPAFIKLGQWASTRRDIFGEVFCISLSQLHSSCHSHHWRDTVQTLEEEFGHDWNNLLEISDQQPIGSGCVAQVYKGHLHTKSMSSITPNIQRGCSRTEDELNKNQRTSFLSRLTRSWSTRSERDVKLERGDEGPLSVAVKVLHPGTVQAMERDMLLMRYGAYWIDWLNPNFHWVALKECFSEFSSVMRKQVVYIILYM